MDKKYRLEIDYSQVTDENIDLAYQLKNSKRDGKSLDGQVLSDEEYDFDKFPKSWLKEITEPQEFDEWFEQQDLPLLESTKTQHERTWKSGIENDHLKIRQRLDSEKENYILKHSGGADSERIQAEHIWNSIVSIIDLGAEDDWDSISESVKISMEPTDDNT